MHLVQIPPDALSKAEMWALICPILERGVERSHNTETVEGNLRAIMAKQKQLWVAISDEKKIIAAAVTMLHQYQTGLKEAVILVLGGEDGTLSEILDLRGELEGWAKVEGCGRVRILARKAWVRHLPDYKLAAYVMSKEL